MQGFREILEGVETHFSGPCVMTCNLAGTNSVLDNLVAPLRLLIRKIKANICEDLEFTINGKRAKPAEDITLTS